MMQSMREKTQGFIAGAIAVVIALTFALWGIQNYLRTGGNQLVAKVNGTEITEQQFQLAYEQVKRVDMLQAGHSRVLDQAAQAKLKDEVLQQLIRKEVILQAAEKMGIKIGREQLWAIAAGMPAFQVDGQFSLSRFKHVVSTMFFSEQVFFDDIQSSFSQIQLEKGIGKTQFLLPNEIELIKKIAMQRRDFSYFIIAPEQFSKDVVVDKDEAKKYYEENQNEFLLPEKISIEYLELSSDDLRSKIDVSDQQLKGFYQSHIEIFSTPKKWEVKQVLLPLSPVGDAKASEKAKEKADEISQELKTKDDLKGLTNEAKVTTSWMMLGKTSSDIIAQLNKMDVGQVSEPLRTKDGYMILKVLAVEPSKPKPYSEVAKDVRKFYERQELTQIFSDANDRLSDLIYINSDSLEPAAKELGLKLRQTELFTKSGAKSGILASDKIINSAFSEPVLQQRYNSSVIEIAPGKVVVLRIKDHVPEKVQPLKDVDKVILQKLQREKAQKKVDEFANQLLAKLQEGKTLQQLVKEYGLTWHKTYNAKYGEAGINAKLVDKVFSLHKPEAANNSFAMVELNGSRTVLHLDKVYDASSQKDEVLKQDRKLKLIVQKLGRFDYQVFLDNLMGKAKIKIFKKSENK
jgi:peptidyl-prolyl cis-trans isomerase D